jgi:hypothetical protein
MLTLGAAPAGASSEIEGIWSFNGGEVAIHPVSGGTFTGVVVTPTKFAECSHQTGEEMWTHISPQPDGSFWGFHQWLFEQTCAANPVLGPTAWRVLQTPAGTRYLKVCFSEPGRTQPTIASSGANANTTYPCSNSAPTAPLPVIVSGSAGTKRGGSQSAEQISFAGTLRLPRAAVCVRQGSLKIKIKDPRYDPLKEVVVRIKHRKIADVHGLKRLKRGIVLKGLPSGAYTLTIVATTILDQKLSGKRTYHSCRRRHATSKVRLHNRRPRKHG